jgi:hypothetical protein
LKASPSLERESAGFEGQATIARAHVSGVVTMTTESEIETAKQPTHPSLAELQSKLERIQGKREYIFAHTLPKRLRDEWRLLLMIENAGGKVECVEPNPDPDPSGPVIRARDLEHIEIWVTAQKYRGDVAKLWGDEVRLCVDYDTKRNKAFDDIDERIDELLEEEQDRQESESGDDA